MKKETVRCVLVKPHVDAVEIEIPNDYKFWQKLVGGLVQVVYPFREEVAIICNDEGKLLNLENNRFLVDPNTLEPYDVIAGDFLVFNAPYDEENFIDMTDEQVSRYTEMYKANTTVMDLRMFI